MDIAVPSNSLQQPFIWTPQEEGFVVIREIYKLIIALGFYEVHTGAVSVE